MVGQCVTCGARISDNDGRWSSQVERSLGLMATKSASLAPGQIALRLPDGTLQIVNNREEAEKLAAQQGIQKRLAHRDETRHKAELASRAAYEAHMSEFWNSINKQNPPTMDDINNARAYASLLGQKASRQVYLDSGYNPCVRDNCTGGVQKHLASPGYKVCRPCFNRDQAAKAQ